MTPAPIPRVTLPSKTLSPVACALTCLACMTAVLTPWKSALSAPLPVRGIHLSAPSKAGMAEAMEFIRTALSREKVNTLILEFNYQFDYQSLPEFADKNSLAKSELRELAKACRDNGIELIPMINCLGHQSWAARNDKLLVKHPEFDETPGKYPNNKDIYCRSYCPLHPKLHDVLFALMDELIEASQAKSFHVGMDEVFIIADPDCPRCKSKAKAELFRDELTLLRDHLKEKGCRTWLWGDRLLNAKLFQTGKWEGSDNDTWQAIDQVPKDLVICDWHYDKAYPTAEYFARKGFDVVSCPWRKPAVALEQLAQMQKLRSATESDVARHGQGMLQTTWCGFAPFGRAYFANGATPGRDKAPEESARCFKELFGAINKAP